MKKISTLVFYILLNLFVTTCFGSDGDALIFNELRVDEYDNFYSSNKGLKPTQFVIVDGEPLCLEDGVDLRGKDLSGIRINNRTLSNVNFGGVKLKDADLSQSHFSHCNFSGSNLEGVRAEETIFTDCDFTEANLHNSRKVKISREQFLSTSNYRTRTLSYDVSHIDNIDFSNFILGDMSVVNAQGGNFDNTRFVWRVCVLNMTVEQLTTTYNYRNKKFTGELLLRNVENNKKPLTGTDISKGRVESLTFENYDFSNVNITDVWIWKNLCFNNCVGLSPEQLKSTTNWKNRMYNFSLSNTELDWSNEDFSGFVFRNGGSLGSGSVAGANFTDSRFGEDFNMENCRDLTIDQIKSTWNYKNNVMTMKLPKEIADQLQAEKETNAATVSNN